MNWDGSHTGLLGFLIDLYLNSGKQELTLAYEGRMNKKLNDIFSDLIVEQFAKDNTHSIPGDTLKSVIKNPLNTEETQEDAETDFEGTQKTNKVLLVSHDSSCVQFAYGKLIENKDIQNLNHSPGKNEPPDENESDNNSVSIKIKGKAGVNTESHFLPYDKNHSWFLVISRVSKN